MYTYTISYIFDHVHNDTTFVAIGKNLHILLLETYKVECFTIRVERQKRNIVYLVDVDRNWDNCVYKGKSKVKVLFTIPKDKARVKVDGLVGIEVQMESEEHDVDGCAKASASMCKYLSKCGVRKAAFYVYAFDGYDGPFLDYKGNVHVGRTLLAMQYKEYMGIPSVENWEDVEKSITM